MVATKITIIAGIENGAIAGMMAVVKPMAKRIVATMSRVSESGSVIIIFSFSLNLLQI